MTDKPCLWWIRRDLRLGDNPALSAAVASGRPVVAVFVRDAAVEALGAAPKWRLGLGLEHLAGRLAAHGIPLQVLTGEAETVLATMVQQTGAVGVVWNRLYDPASIARDTAVKSALQAQGVAATSHNAHLLFEPWTVQTKEGSFYKVFTPFWNTVRGRDVPTALPAPAARPPVPRTDFPLNDFSAAMHRGAAVSLPYQRVGEETALQRLADFTDCPIRDYRQRRDLPGTDATSGLSENLALGEISPRTIWHAGRRALHDGAAGAETFLKELVWREFAAALLYHTPHIERDNWRDGWDAFPWRGDNPDAERWRRGMTGEPFVDAAMRELYVTGKMHNRARMIAASYLTKHLLTGWRVGQAWFAETLTDWDAASNAMGWQWVAGSGPDAAPYFRIFNPATQAAKFDADSRYRRRWIAEGQKNPPQTALDFFAAAPRSWALDPARPYPAPVVDLAEGRARALAAYARR